MKKFKIFIVLLILITFTLLLAGCDPAFVGFDSDRLSSSLQNGASNSQNQPSSGSQTNSNYNVIINYVDFTPIEGGLPDIVEGVKDSVVSIFCEVIDSNGKTSQSSGSGVFFGYDEDTNTAFLLTCCHVIDKAVSIKAILDNGKEIACEFIGGDDENDVAVLKAEGIDEGFDVAGIRDLKSYPIRPGESVFAIGNPLGTLGGSVTQGIISGVERSINMDGVSMTLLQIDVAVNPGNSGGPLFDFTGALVGIVNAKSVGTEVEGIGYSIRIDDAIEDANSILATAGNPDYDNLGYIEGKVRLGVTVQGAKEDNAYYYTIVSLSDYGSVYWHNKNATSTNKIEVNDIITGVILDGEDRAFTDINTLGDIIKSLKVGDKITLKIKHPTGSYFTGIKYDTREIEVQMRQYVYGLV